MTHGGTKQQTGQDGPKWATRGTGSADWIASMIIQPAIRFGSWSIMAINIFLVQVTSCHALGAAEADDHAVRG